MLDLKKTLQNPFKANFFIFGIILIITVVYLLCSVYFKFTLLDWSDYAINTLNNVVAGVFTSALLLLVCYKILCKKIKVILR